MRATVGLRMPAKPEYLVLGRLALSGIARIHPIDPDDLGDLKLAITEACSNSMRHAYGEQGGSVDIRIDVDGRAIAVEVCDDGPGFDLDERPQGSDELDEGGLGLAIIEALVDELDVGRPAEGAGSRVRFRKHLKPVTFELPIDEGRRR